MPHPRPLPFLRRKRHPTRWILGGLAVVLAIGAGTAGAFVALLLRQPLLPAVELSEAEQQVFRSDELRAAALDRSLNILVMGVDDLDPIAARSDDPSLSTTNWRGRSDTILLARLDPKSGTVNVLSIPRDTRVRLEGYGIQKMNNANTLGGPALAALGASALVGDIPIDRYVRVNTDGVAALIDAIGGVEINVPSRMEYTDHTQGLYIDLQPGWQRLNGEQAHHFIRFRYDELGDIGRVQRQQMLLRAISQQLLQPMTLARLPQILRAVQQNLDTNLTWDELLSLIQFVIRSGDNRFNMVLLPGRFSQPDEYPTSFWLVDQVGAYRVGINYFGASVQHGLADFRPPAQQRVAIQNASGFEGMGQNMVTDLRQKGFRNVYTLRDHPENLEVTQIIAQQGDVQTAAEVQALLGFGVVKVQSTGDIGSDITVRIGQDWASFWYPEILEEDRPLASLSELRLTN